MRHTQVSVVQKRGVSLTGVFGGTPKIKKKLTGGDD